MKIKLILLSVAVSLLGSSQVFGSLLFSEDFESGMGQWTGKSDGVYYGQTVTDPVSGSNNAMNFTEMISAGDVFTSTEFTAGTYWLSFDYFGDTTMFNSPNDNTGGYVGYSNALPGSHSWLIGTGTASGATDTLVDDDQWHSYSLSFTSADSFHLMFEDYVGSGGGAGDAYFDNINLSDTAPVPEPATMLLFGVGLTGLAALKIRKKKV